MSLDCFCETTCGAKKEREEEGRGEECGEERRGDESKARREEKAAHDLLHEGSEAASVGVLSVVHKAAGAEACHQAPELALVGVAQRASLARGAHLLNAVLERA